MVDAHVSGACGAIREGSSPSFDIKKRVMFVVTLFLMWTNNECLNNFYQ